MNSQPHTQLLELHLIIPVPLGGVAESQLRRYLNNLVAVIPGRFTDTLRSVPSDVQQLRLSITVSAIGEPHNSESLTSTKQLGSSSPTNPSAEDSSQSQSAPELEVTGHTTRPIQRQSSSSSPILQQILEKHHFRGWLHSNCLTCNMPATARQHEIMYIHNNDILTFGEAKPFA